MTDETEVEVDRLDERLEAVEWALEDLRLDLKTVTNRDVPLLTGTIRALLGADIDTLDDLPAAGRAFQDHHDELEARLQALEDRMEMLGDVSAAKSTKAEKFAAVLAFAANKRSGADKVAVLPGEIKGCTGVSRRYAYDLLEMMADEIDGVQVREEQRVTTGNGVKHKAKALLIDCSQVREESDAVNQFTTGGASRGTQ
jgi:hypothetical protein